MFQFSNYNFTSLETNPAHHAHTSYFQRASSLHAPIPVQQLPLPSSPRVRHFQSPASLEPAGTSLLHQEESSRTKKAATFSCRGRTKQQPQHSPPPATTPGCCTGSSIFPTSESPSPPPEIKDRLQLPLCSRLRAQTARAARLWVQSMNAPNLGRGTSCARTQQLPSPQKSNEEIYPGLGYNS